MRLGQPFTLRTQASTSAGSPPAATTAAIGTAVMFGGIGIASSAGGGIDASSVADLLAVHQPCELPGSQSGSSPSLAPRLRMNSRSERRLR